MGPIMPLPIIPTRIFFMSLPLLNTGILYPFSSRTSWTGPRHIGISSSMRPRYDDAYGRDPICRHARDASMRSVKTFLLFAACLATASAAVAQNPHLIVYEGEKGPGRGKHIVFL